MGPRPDYSNQGRLSGVRTVQRRDWVQINSFLFLCFANRFFSVMTFSHVIQRTSTNRDRGVEALSDFQGAKLSAKFKGRWGLKSLSVCRKERSHECSTPTSHVWTG